MLFFAALILSCKPAPSSAPPPIEVAPLVFVEAVKLCGVTVFQEQPGEALHIIGNNDKDAEITISSNDYRAVVNLSPDGKTAIAAHLVRGQELTVKVELFELDGASGAEKCQPAIVTVK